MSLLNLCSDFLDESCCLQIVGLVRCEQEQDPWSPDPTLVAKVGTTRSVNNRCSVPTFSSPAGSSLAGVLFPYNLSKLQTPMASYHSVLFRCCMHARHYAQSRGRRIRHCRMTKVRQSPVIPNCSANNHHRPGSQNDVCRREKIRCDVVSEVCAQAVKFETSCQFISVSMKRTPG